MDEEEKLVSESLRVFDTFRSIKHVGDYLEIIPEPEIRGKAQHHARKYLRENPGVQLTGTELTKVGGLISVIILNEIIERSRAPFVEAYADSAPLVKKKLFTPERDGAELFYRRALRHLSVERHADAERLLKRSVEIDPEFIDGWETYCEVLLLNGKEQLAAQARLQIRSLKGEL